jgi:hypothetical protein
MNRPCKTAVTVARGRRALRDDQKVRMQRMAKEPVLIVEPGSIAPPELLYRKTDQA